MSLLSESKNGNRGPLIAVIKIQLDEQNIDRIFLHLNDDDEQLAEEFIFKHSLNPVIKSHIFKKIQMSRSAVDQEALKRKNQPLYGSENIKTGSFATPLQKRDSWQEDSSAEKSYEGFSSFYDPKEVSRQEHRNQTFNGHLLHNYQQKEQKQISNSKKQLKQLKRDKQYISYDDSQQSSLAQRHNTSNRPNNKNYTQQQPKQNKQFLLNSKFQSFNQSQIPPQTRVFSNTAASQSKYNSKYKNLYDVSGLKLNNKYPKALDQKRNLFSEEATFKKGQQHNGEKHNLEYLSSQSSQGLFQKQILSKESPFDTLKCQISKDQGGRISLSNNKGSFKKFDYLNQNCQDQETIENRKHHKHEPFLQVSEPIQDAINFKETAYEKYKQIQELLNRRDSAQERIYPFQKVSSNLNCKKQSSHNEKSTTFDNYVLSISTLQISFQKSANILPIGIQKGLSSEDRVSPQNQSQKQHNCHRSSPKIIGSIRSNNKQTDNFYEFKKGKNPLSQINLHNDNTVSERYKNLEQTTKFSQDKLFHDIKDLQQVYQMQENRQMNEEQTNRPSRVKFYKKDELKSLRQSTLSHSMSKSQISRISKEVTNRLYNEAEIKKKYLNTLKFKAQNIREEELFEKEQLTHKPQINLLSKIIGQRRIKDNKSLEDHLIEQGKLVGARRQQMMSHQARKKLEQCSFHPHLNQQTRKINSSKSKSRLSNRSEMKCSSVFQNQNTFHPSINKLSHELSKSKGTFQERQKSFVEQKTSNLFRQTQQKRQQQKIDSFTKQKLFQPQLTNKTIEITKKNGRQTKNIHSYLYELSKVERILPQQLRIPTITQESQKIIEELHQKRLNWLFTQLDSNQDGSISANSISIDHIPTKILQIIAPVLYQMQELNTQLNLEDFKLAIKNLHKGLDPHQKNLLYNHNYSKKPIRN